MFVSGTWHLSAHHMAFGRLGLPRALLGHTSNKSPAKQGDQRRCQEHRPTEVPSNPGGQIISVHTGNQTGRTKLKCWSSVWSTNTLETLDLHSKKPFSVKYTNSFIRVFQGEKEEEGKEKESIKLYMYCKTEVRFQKC